MYPFTHISIAFSSVRGGDRLTGPESNGEIDYRLVALGSILPDLIDKPLKWFIFRKQLPDDHTFGHTLLLPAGLLGAGLLRGDKRLLALGLGCLTHPLVDPVVERPKNLFWPLLGTSFPKGMKERGLGPYSVAGEALLIAGALIAHSRSEKLRGWLHGLLRQGRVEGADA